MKQRMKINPDNAIMCVPRSMIEDGFTGEVDAYHNALTVTIIKPGTDLKKAIESLRIVILDMELRQSAGQNEAPLAG